jgi:hypothetical protein
MNDHVQLLEGLVTATRIIDRAQAFAYEQSQRVGKAGREKDIPDYRVLFAALVMARLQLQDAFGLANNIAERGMDTDTGFRVTAEGELRPVR